MFTGTNIPSRPVPGVEYDKHGPDTLTVRGMRIVIAPGRSTRMVITPAASTGTLVRLAVGVAAAPLGARCLATRRGAAGCAGEGMATAVAKAAVVATARRIQVAFITPPRAKRAGGRRVTPARPQSRRFGHARAGEARNATDRREQRAAVRAVRGAVGERRSGGPAQLERRERNGRSACRRDRGAWQGEGGPGAAGRQVAGVHRDGDSARRRC